MQLDTSILDMLHGLSSPGEPSALQEILDVFADDGRQVLARLQAAAAEGDPEATRRAAHRMKGASANVGATELAAALAAIEHEAPSGVTDDLRAQIDAIGPHFDATLEALRRYEPKRSR